MIYRLFKHYMKKLVKEYHVAYEIEFTMTQNENMRPDFYWLEKYLNDEYEWTEKDRSYVRRGKR